MNTRFKLNIQLLDDYIKQSDLSKLEDKVRAIHQSLWNKTCKGHDFLGWLSLPFDAAEQLNRVKDLAAEIRDHSDGMVSIGIGGSYLGARAAIEFLAEPFAAKNVLFLGHHISGDYTDSLFSYIQDKDVYVNVISKSGGTTEPAVAFRLLRRVLSESCSEEELKRRIIATTDANKGILHDIAKAKGYRRFVIPDDVGGRFSVLTPVGLLPIAAAGFDIEQLLKGAQDMATLCKENDNVLENPALTYAAARYLLYEKGKKVEALSAFEPYFQYIGEWWKQLFGESEGKENKGIYPTSANLTTDLHSLGQYFQQGERVLFETFLTLDKTTSDTKIPEIEGDPDQLNFVAGQDLHAVNQKAYLGTKYAHYEGDLPNMTLSVPERNEYVLGQLFYFFEFAVAVSGLLLDVNPFNQPGVEAYKKNMFALLGKPGFEDRKQELDDKIKGES
ncbi:MAG: glucose-6-phosphate isomerase [candidate division KSB1 bacterium]|nr:glucose-6-phosphate isomerase [candidate division KSB1 bacterium]